MQDKSIDNALLALRKRIIHQGCAGLEHVEALLILRGVPMPRVLPPRKADAARYGMMRRLLLEALRDGPKTQRDLSDHVAARRPELPPGAAYQRTAQALQKLRLAGLVAHEGRLWRLAP